MKVKKKKINMYGKKEPSVTVQGCHIADLRLVKMAGWFNCKNLANQLTCSHKRPAAMHTEETCPTAVDVVTDCRLLKC